ncbi:hypothetical protein DPMN_101337 [Dreissena polymorpha]|uniref:Uncharacterized protein n=1 Tax=Dreissena polymorpha TaxID=45954 RepID=A0A9D4LIS0_DREPO|nr:hypothetical protein DPMN_101337 [Dreissena polymorpha]
MVEDMVEMENDDHDKENVKPSAVMEPHKEDLKTNVTNESSERKEVNAFKTHNPEKPLDTKSKIKQYQHVNKVKTNGANAATKLQGNGKSSERQCNENHSAKAKTRHLSHEEQGARPKTALHGGFEMKGSEIDSEQRGNKVHPMVEGQKKSGSKLLSMVNEPLQQHKGFVGINPVKHISPIFKSVPDCVFVCGFP